MPQSYRRARASLARAGTTLIELMVVLVVMALIASAIAVSVLHAYENARRHTTETNARAVQSATLQYLIEEPAVDCPTVPELVHSGILDSTTSTDDGWGTPFAIECDDGHVVHVRSAGPDRQTGTHDDVGF